MMRSLKYCSIALLLLAGCRAHHHRDSCESSIPLKVSDALPEIGKWMYENGSHDDKPAQWLGFKLNNKTLYEPINLIIVDTLSTSENASRTLMEKRFGTAGFNARPGHTAAYKGKMDNRDFTQLPDTSTNKAFSNYLWTFTNDHARLFGPYLKDGIYFWIGAASRERGLSHEYVTFKEAEKEFEGKLVKFAAVKRLGCYNLHNTQNNETDTTGDHDGFAVVLQIR
ncbi:hypothetical protein [Chitinophaga sp. HK235]|uniref:hypothetical protein n=1 Tax=Chitinophaga sp. HK235 TaxID=2952571 RepID=UPI001BA99F4E|nr:hypothetical protein [Chitinophaga sp. HK235]